MTVLSLQWLLAWSRRRPVGVTRTRRPVRPGRRAHADSFFADPGAVEDDARRMRPDRPARLR